MSEAMNRVMVYLETGEGNLWGDLYELDRDELIRLFEEVDYATYQKLGESEQRKVYAMAVGSLKDIYQEDE